jgi:hypothetical protein
MIKSVNLGEEIVITAKNRIGILADIALMLSNNGINIDAAMGYEADGTAKLFLVTKANIVIVDELRKKGYKPIKETEVVVVDLENKPGALKVVTTALKEKSIDIKHLYVTSPMSGANSSRMVFKTSDNETAIAVLSEYVVK